MTLPEHELLAARILIVDDQLANVHLLTRVLTEAGYTAVTATQDPLAVCALHAVHDYDLILLDMQLPVMDGCAVMDALRASPVHGPVPVIVLTAHPDHKMRALQAGAKDFISKPFDLLEVKTRIRNMLEMRLLYRRLAAQNQVLERTVQARTAELQASEARYRRLTELASDWHWEQDEHGHFTQVSGPVVAMLGWGEPVASTGATGPHDGVATDGSRPVPAAVWNEAERVVLRAAIEARQPFLDLPLSRVNADGSVQTFRVSGEPMFSPGACFVGYRGVGVETTLQPPRRVGGNSSSSSSGAQGAAGD